MVYNVLSVPEKNAMSALLSVRKEEEIQMANYELSHLGFRSVKGNPYLRVKFDEMIQKLSAEAKVKPYTDLSDGKKYGLFRFSSDATAFRRNRSYPKHGEIYLDVYTFDKASGKFVSKNALGQVYETKASEGLLVVELDEAVEYRKKEAIE